MMKINAHSVRGALLITGASLTIATTATTARADVRLPHALSDHMVVQKGAPVCVWGWADENEPVQVTFAGKSATTTAKNGKWRVSLPPVTRYGGPYEIAVTGKNRVILHDVLVGEVWICSGQSNMDFTMAKTEKRYFAGVENEKQETAAAQFPQIRSFSAEWTLADEPQTDARGTWAVCSPETVGEFSAVAYYFARDLHQKLNAPIGLITVAYGASTAQAWMSGPSLDATPNGRKLREDYAAASRDWDAGATQARYATRRAEWDAAVKQAKADNKPAPTGRAPGAPRDPRQDQHNPSVLYNGMIAPFLDYPVRGVIWYQGESNVATADTYRDLMLGLIADWRRAFGSPRMPFLQVQIAPNGEPDAVPRESRAAVVRDAQRFAAQTVPGVGLVVTTDIGEIKDIHPRRKAPVGERLALLARRIAYGEKNLLAEGPVFQSLRVENDTLSLRFGSVGAGLSARAVDNRDSPLAADTLSGFAVCGADNKWYPAQARVAGRDTVEVWSPYVKSPVAARYGWANYPVANLFNSAGLPASPFRTDTAEK